LIEDSHFVRDAALGRLRTEACDSTGGTTARTLKGSDTACDAKHGVFWMRGYGSWGHTDSNGNAARLVRTTGGFLMGVDRFLGNSWRIGVLGGYSNTDFSVSGRHS
jgi:outer membrane autotransporter protein